MVKTIISLRFEQITKNKFQIWKPPTTKQRIRSVFSVWEIALFSYLHYLWEFLKSSEWKRYGFCNRIRITNGEHIENNEKMCYLLRALLREAKNSGCEKRHILKYERMFMIFFHLNIWAFVLHKIPFECWIRNEQWTRVKDENK